MVERCMGLQRSALLLRQRKAACSRRVAPVNQPGAVFDLCAIGMGQRTDTRHITAVLTAHAWIKLCCTVGSACHAICAFSLWLAPLELIVVRWPTLLLCEFTAICCSTARIVDHLTPTLIPNTCGVGSTGGSTGPLPSKKRFIGDSTTCHGSSNLSTSPSKSPKCNRIGETVGVSNLSKCKVTPGNGVTYSNSMGETRLCQFSSNRSSTAILLAHIYS